MIAVSRSMQVWLAALAFSLPSAVGFTQSKNEVSEVRVEASRVPTMTTAHTARGDPVQVAQLSQVVSYADLDLATHTGATQLEHRINNAAKTVCKELERLYPSGTQQGLGSGSCVNDAVKGAMAQANVAIAAAEKAYESAKAPQK